MSQRLSVPDIANIIGVEEEIITNVLAREDEELKPYLYVEPVISSQGNESLETPFAGEGEAAQKTQTAYMLGVEGLSVLITKLAFNIQTSDLIENLACQVLHLTVLQEDIAELQRRTRQLQFRNDELQHRLKRAQTENRNLKATLAEATKTQSRGWFRDLIGGGKSRV